MSYLYSTLYSEVTFYNERVPIFESSVAITKTTTEIRMMPVSTHFLLLNLSLTFTGDPLSLASLVSSKPKNPRPSQVMKAYFLKDSQQLDFGLCVSDFIYASDILLLIVYSYKFFIILRKL